MKCDKIIEIPNAHDIHGPAGHRSSLAQAMSLPMASMKPRSSMTVQILDDPSQYVNIYTAIDGDTMEIAWQVMVSGNLDNTDCDYQGKYAFSTSYKLGNGHDPGRDDRE